MSKRRHLYLPVVADQKHQSMSDEETIDEETIEEEGGIWIADFMAAEKIYTHYIIPIVIVLISIAGYFIVGYYILSIVTPFLLLNLIEASRIFEPRWPKIKIVPSSIYQNNGKIYWRLLFVLAVISRFFMPFTMSILFETITDNNSIFYLEEYIHGAIIVLISPFIVDILYFIEHLIFHKVDFLWKCIHQIHHTP
eukprot:477037_1